MVARSAAGALVIQATPRSTPTFGTFCFEDFVMKNISMPNFPHVLVQEEQCQLMVIECTLSAGKLPQGGLSRKSVVKITDFSDISAAVYYGHKATNQIKQSSISQSFVI